MLMPKKTKETRRLIFTLQTSSPNRIVLLVEVEKPVTITIVSVGKMGCPVKTV